MNPNNSTVTTPICSFSLPNANETGSFVGIQKGTPAGVFSLFLVIFVPIFSISSLLVFLYFKPSSIFLRKRPTRFIVFSYVGLFVIYIATCVYDYVGKDYFPCWFYAILFYMATAFPTQNFVLKVFHFLLEVNEIRYITKDGEYIHLVDITPAATFQTFFSHIRFSFFKSKDDHFRSIQFTKTYTFVCFWILVNALPTLIGYFYRLCSDPLWNQNCYGCGLSEFDCIFFFL